MSEQHISMAKGLVRSTPLHGSGVDSKFVVIGPPVLLNKSGDPAAALDPLRVVGSAPARRDFVASAAALIENVAPGKGKRFAAKLDSILDPAVSFVDLGKLSLAKQERFVLALTVPGFAELIRDRLRPSEQGAYAVCWLDAAHKPMVATPWPAGGQPIAVDVLHLPSRDFVFELSRVLKGLPHGEAFAIANWLVSGVGQLQGAGVRFCSIDLQPCFRFLARNYDKSQARLMLIQLMNDKGVTSQLCLHGSGQAFGAWNRVRVLWPLGGELYWPIVPAPSFTGAMCAVIDEVHEREQPDPGKTAQELSRCFAAMESGDGGQPAVVVDLTGLPQLAYRLVEDARRQSPKAFAAALDVRATGLGPLKYFVAWASSNDRRAFFPAAWPHGAPMTRLSVTGPQRHSMRERVGEILGIKVDDTGPITDALLSGFGTVKVPGEKLSCIDLRPIKHYLARYHPDTAEDWMRLLTTNSHALVRSDRGEPWSPDFVEARLIVPGGVSPAS